MIKFDCEKCGRIEMSLLDGYGVGDRLLEGVMFECRQNDDNTFDVAISPKHAEYFSKLNEKKWLGEIKEAAKHQDVFTCPHCGSDTAPENML